MSSKQLFVELNGGELKELNGGEVPRSYYMDSDTMKQNWKNLCTLGGVVVGFFEGLVDF